MILDAQASPERQVESESCENRLNIRFESQLPNPSLPHHLAFTPSPHPDSLLNFLGVGFIRPCVNCSATSKLWNKKNTSFNRPPAPVSFVALILFSAVMSSSVYYKFKSQRQESRVTFDGTGISVFDLKKEIILQNNLKASDIDLLLFDHSEQGASLEFKWTP